LVVATEQDISRPTTTEFAENTRTSNAGAIAFGDSVAIEAAYCPRRPEDSPLYAAVAGHLETFLARQRERDREIPAFVEQEFREFLDCGVLARGFIRVHCDACGLDRVVPYSCYAQRETICSSPLRTAILCDLARDLLQIVSGQQAKQ
jgi:Transposase zinc-binding domain